MTDASKRLPDEDEMRTAWRIVELQLSAVEAMGRLAAVFEVSKDLDLLEKVAILLAKAVAVGEGA